MKLARYFSAMAVAALLAACGGKGSPAAAPDLLSVTGEEGQITLNWTVVPGVQYRVYCAPGSSVDNYSWYNTFGGLARAGAQDAVLPPFTVDGVQNNTDYACTVDGRYNNGAAGPAAASMATHTQSAGSAIWQTTSAITGLTGSVRATAAGTLSGFTTDKFFAAGTTVAGTSGQLWVSDDYASGTWSAVSNLPALLGDLNTVIVYGGAVFVAGSGGVLAYSSDLQTWVTVDMTGPIQKIASSGTRLVAVGASGLVRYSTDGAHWVTAAGTGSAALSGVTYSEAGYWVAVGATGSILVSTTADASSWIPAAGAGTGVAQTANLNSVAALKVQTPNTTNYVYKLVAVGNSGQVGYSENGQDWYWKTTAPVTNLMQVAAGNQTLVKLDSSATPSSIYPYSGGQFMIAGAGGKVWRSGDALAWDKDTLSWEDVSSSANTLADAVSLFRYAKTGHYSSGVSYAYTWLLYGADGAGRYAR